MAFAERLRKIIKDYELSVGDFAKKCNISNSSLQRYLQGINEPKLSFLKKLNFIFDVNLHWLLTGEGAPYKKKETALICLHPTTNISKERYFLLPLVEAEVGSDIEDFLSKVINWIPIPLSWLKEMGFSSLEEYKKILLLKMENKTMHPTIPQKSILILDSNSKSIEQVINGKIYLIKRLDNTICLRRVVYDNNKLFLLPDNWQKYSFYKIEIPPHETLSKYILGRLLGICYYNLT